MQRKITGYARRLDRPIVLLLLSMLLSSCFSTIPVPRYSAPPKRTAAVPAPVQRPYLPDGWADITSKTQQPQIRLWLVNREFSGTMILRELQTDAATLKVLTGEEMNVIAGISLRSKFPENDPDFRVTRVPAVIDMKRNFSSYAYTEKGLLRRVVVFRKNAALMELELMQEQAAAEFEALTNDLVMFATRLYER